MSFKYSLYSVCAPFSEIEIGNKPNVMIYDHYYDYTKPLKQNFYISDPIVIGNNVWIGSNSIILKGSTIGDNVVIGAGSVVKDYIPNNTVYVQKRELLEKSIKMKKQL